jgi:hypothetical protein
MQNKTVLNPKNKNCNCEDINRSLLSERDWAYDHQNKNWKHGIPNTFALLAASEVSPSLSLSFSPLIVHLHRIFSLHSTLKSQGLDVT